MDQLKMRLGVLRPLVLGLVLGGLGTGLVVFRLAKQQATDEARQLNEETARRRWNDFAEEANGTLGHLSAGQSYLCYMRADESGWLCAPIDSYAQLQSLMTHSEKEILIPVFPTVYTPRITDKVYYDTILNSGIKHGDKVLVIGAGSGADAWVAWLKSQSLIHVIEVNPMAVANITATARIGGFPVKTIRGDIRHVELPRDFSKFDFVLWNMPYLADSLEENAYHDGDDGTILRRFLELLPSLLKKGGQAIVLNVAAAKELITSPGVTTQEGDNCMLFVIPNP